jgi:hypothetical protein
MSILSERNTLILFGGMGNWLREQEHPERGKEPGPGVLCPGN